MALFKGKKEFYRIVGYVLLASVIAVNLGLTFRSLKRSHYSPINPTSTEPGAFTDFYPRWYGAREMIFHGKNPYSAELTLQNQRAFYGAFDLHDGVSRDPMGFAYPATVAVPLLPFLFMSYRVAMAFMGLLCIGVYTWGLLKWSEWCCPHLSGEWRLMIAALGMGLQPAVSPILLLQPSVFAFLGLTAGFYCLRRGKLTAAGLCLALAATKPQLAVFVAVGLHIYAVFDWKKYRKVIVSFWAMTVAMTAFVCIFQSGWPLEWLRALAQYKDEAFGAISIVDLWVTNRPIAWLAKAVLILVTLTLWRKQKDFNGVEFTSVYALSMAAGLLVMPAGHIYNHVFVYPIWFLCADQIKSPKRFLKITAIVSFAVALLFWGWSTLPLILKNVPSLVNYLALSPKIFENYNGWAWPWRVAFINPLMLYLGSLFFLIRAVRSPGTP